MPRKKTPARLTREIAETLGRRSHRNGSWRDSKVQSILFARSRWTPSEAKVWASRHGYRSTKVHATDNYLRLRQFAPVSGTQKRTITFGDGIRAVIEQVK